MNESSRATMNDRNEAIAAARVAGKTLREISRSHGLSAERVRQICKKGARLSLNGFPLETAENAIDRLCLEAVSPAPLLQHRLSLPGSTLAGERARAWRAAQVIDRDAWPHEFVLTARVWNAIFSDGIASIHSLASRSEACLASLLNLGAKSIRQITAQLEIHGMALRKNIRPGCWPFYFHIRRRCPLCGGTES